MLPFLSEITFTNMYFKLLLHVLKERDISFFFSFYWDTRICYTSMWAGSTCALSMNPKLEIQAHRCLSCNCPNKGERINMGKQCANRIKTRHAKTSSLKLRHTGFELSPAGHRWALYVLIKHWEFCCVAHHIKEILHKLYQCSRRNSFWSLPALGGYGRQIRSI